MRSKGKKRKNKSKIIVLLISCIFLVSLLTTFKGNSSVTVSASEEPLGEGTILPDSNKGEVLSILKSVEKDPKVEGRYKINLKAQGKPVTTEVKKADIVMAVDTSSSMMYDIGKIKESMKNFCDIIRKTNGDIRICLVQFNNEAESSNYLGINDKEKDGTFTFDTNISKINIKKSKGTNTQSGIMKTGEMLAQARADAQKYVVFFTDGLPTYSYNYEYYDSGSILLGTFKRNLSDSEKLKKYVDGSYDLIGNGGDSYDIHFKAAQIEYNKIIGGIKTVGGIGYKNPFEANGFIGLFELGEYMYWWNLNKKPIEFLSTENNKQAAFYSIGIITDNIELNRTMGEEFLKTINNSGYQYSSTFDDANKFYNNIANDISVKINSNIATNVVLKDTINGKFFKLAPEDQRNLKGIDAKNVQVTEDNDNELITFNIGDMTQNLDISFNIDVKDEYLSGANIPTNIEAVASYKSPITNADTNQTYNIPHVSIEPKIGKIIFSKEVYTKDSGGNLISSNLHDNDKFNVELIGDDKSYNLSVSQGEGEKTLEFYMKKHDTLINHRYVNTWRDIGFVDVGEYNINEILKMRYINDKILYKYSENDDYKVLNDKIKIDKDHPVIYIRLINVYKDSNEWTDDEEKNNELIYPSLIQ